jgi:hypothetical protein
MLFPLPGLWDKAPVAATGNRPQAGGVYGAALATLLFLRLNQFSLVTQCQNEPICPPF